MHVAFAPLCYQVNVVVVVDGAPQFLGDQKRATLLQLGMLIEISYTSLWNTRHYLPLYI